MKSSNSIVAGRFAALRLCSLLPVLFAVCPVQAQSDSSALVESGVVAAKSCPKEESTKFVCGVANSEDLVQLPNSHWVVSTGKPGPGVPSGGLFLIDARNKVVEPFFPTARSQFQQDQKLFGGCPGKVDEEGFHSEGLNVRATGNGNYTLYVINHGGRESFVNHGGRESTEIFRINVQAKKPTITWIGCVVTPPMPQTNQRAVGNAVAPLPNDAFAITINPASALNDMKNPEVAGKLATGQITGRVMIWSPATGWKMVPGSELAGNNGIEASPDGKWLYVSALFELGVYRLSVGKTPVDRTVVKTDFHPDNIRWGDDGFLYLTGPGVTDRGIFAEALACMTSSVCASPYKVLRIDPRTLQSDELVDEPGGPLFGLGTGVAKVGNEIWISSVRGTRIAVFPLKPAPRSK